MLSLTTTPNSGYLICPKNGKLALIILILKVQLTKTSTQQAPAQKGKK